ncbi:amino acid deaminase/aldolase [Nocardioides caldifontis]|uniref:amino acid deaminase/aldolase n=1 Tax=Nocardioides caldifontis TaxID=2588938 RepID=UPI0011E030A5|nr:amino acid deaminase/aldolase [Nocardioides caldifontis]
MHRAEPLLEATRHLDPPFGVVDLDAFERNARSLEQRAGGTPLRVATKSLRVRDLVDRALARPGFCGALAFTLPEALWLSEQHDGICVGYPTADRGALRALAADDRARERVAIMVDSVEHLDFVQGVVGTDGPPIRACLDLDASLRLLRGTVHLGPRRSPLHAPDELRALAEAVAARSRFALVGVMCYEGQIAGIPDEAGSLPRRTAVRLVQRRSAEELRERRAEAIRRVREVADLEFVNGGGTGSVESTAQGAEITDVAAGSGLLCPTLFDHYSSFRAEPAAFFALSVVRRPGPDHATVLGGGWVASGPPGRDRLPSPWWPERLRMVAAEGAGEVQTPLTGPGARRLAIGDRVLFRHAKSGELAEHLETVHLVSGGELVGSVPTYRGEGRTFL